MVLPTSASTARPARRANPELISSNGLPGIPGQRLIANTASNASPPWAAFAAASAVSFPGMSLSAHLDNIIEMIYALDKIAPGIANNDTLLYGVEVKFYES